ncbi:MAG: acyl-CoA dehydrogenase family protein [Pseudomonadales bacterium]
MDFSFTEEQQMIRDTAEAFLADVSSSEAVRRAMALEQGYEDKIWARICGEMYWQAIHIPEQYGGMGLGYVELVSLFEQMGRYLLCSPFLSTVGYGVNALLVAGTEAQQATYLPQIAEGSLTATLAHTGTNGRFDAAGVQATWRKDGDQLLLNGCLRFVADGHSADLLIIAAREEGSEAEDGISLFVVPAQTDGVQREWLPTMDQTRKQAQINLDQVSLPLGSVMQSAGEAWPLLSRIIDLATIAVAAEQMGGGQQILDMTVEYTKERVQFNRPIAGFQAVKHIAADMMLKSEVSRSAIYYAACVANEALTGGPLAGELGEAASVAKAYCSEAYFDNAGDAMQLHGGVGFTWEYDVHLYFKRAKSSGLLLGNAPYHRERIAKLLLDS